MTRTGIIARSVLGIVGFTFLLLCGAYIAIVGWAFSEGGPHAFKGDVRIGLIFWLIALALIGSLTFRLARDGRQTGTGPKEIPLGTRVTE